MVDTSRRESAIEVAENLRNTVRELLGQIGASRKAQGDVEQADASDAMNRAELQKAATERLENTLRAVSGTCRGAKELIAVARDPVAGGKELMLLLREELTSETRLVRRNLVAASGTIILLAIAGGDPSNAQLFGVKIGEPVHLFAALLCLLLYLVAHFASAAWPDWKALKRIEESYRRMCDLAEEELGRLKRELDDWRQSGLTAPQPVKEDVESLLEAAEDWQKSATKRLASDRGTSKQVAARQFMTFGAPLLLAAIAMALIGEKLL